MKTKPVITILRIATLRAPDMSQAHLEMRTDGKRWSVARYLPAGMDIAPDHWTWPTEDQANTNFTAQLEYLKTKFGFELAEDLGQINP